MEVSRRLLKRQLSERRFETLAEALLSIIERSISFVTWRKVNIGYWGAAVALFLWTVISTLSLSVWAHQESLSDWQNIDESLAILQFLVFLHVWGGLVAICQLLSSRYYARLISDTLGDSVIDSISEEKDLQDLRDWLRKTFSKTRQLRFCTVMAVSLGTVSPVVALFGEQSDMVSLGTVALCFAGWFQGAMGWYFLIPGLALPGRLAKYNYEVFPLDPASSRLMQSLTNMVQAALFVATVIATLFTSGLFYLGFDDLPSQIAFLVFGTWGPLLSVFVYSQISLAKIVEKAKWKSLDEIQAGISRVNQDLGEIGSDDLGRLKELMELHERIRSSKATAFDWKSTLSLLNTLILPAASFAVALWKK